MRKKRYLSIVITLLLASVELAFAEYPHAQPPEGDPCLTNRFGRSWCDPIYSGYLLIDGKYIDAPYIVEQRGYKTMVNGEQVGRISPRTVLPLPPPEPVTEDPSFPDDLTKESSLGDAIMHPKVIDKWHYWKHRGLYGEERVKAEIEFLSQLPCVARVEDTGRPGLVHTRDLRLWDHRGKSILLPVPLSSRPAKYKPTEKDIYGWAVNRKRGLKSSLTNGRLVLVRHGEIAAESGCPDDSPRWNQIFETMAGGMPSEIKVKKLKELGFLHKTYTLISTNSVFPITYFKPTEQIWKRLKDDESWKENAASRLNALTNGWHTISPAFQRDKTEPSKEIAPPIEKDPSKEEKSIAVTNTIEYGVRVPA